MALPTQNFQQIVSNIATATQGSCKALVNYTKGSVLLAIAQATAGVSTWLQSLILQVLLLTRKVTSYGADKDTWLADFGFKRLGAAAASGLVTFSRFTPSQQAFIPLGAGVQTADGTQNFTVAQDSTNPAYSLSLLGYILPIGTASISVPVVATIPGTAGNIQASTLTVITTAIPGVDTATNPAAFINGIDAESDPAADDGFILYLAKDGGTKTSIEYAVKSTQQGLTCQITENTRYDGTYDNGYTSVYIDDGSGYPSANLLNNIAAAIDPIRSLNSRVAVFAPVVLFANVSMILTTAPGLIHTGVTNAVVAALQNFINGLPLGISLPWSQLAAIAYGVPGVQNVSAVLLNGSTADLTATVQNKLLAGSIVVS